MCRELKNFKWIKKKERAKSVKVDECQNIINDFFAQTPRRHSKYEWELVRALFFLHTQKINPPGIYEGNSPEIFDAVTFSKVCEQAALCRLWPISIPKGIDFFIFFMLMVNWHPKIYSCTFLYTGECSKKYIKFLNLVQKTYRKKDAE